jgi:predicted house-cleaning NTP pyrophosphatase (Maf/HAM1 superfamily)
MLLAGMCLITQYAKELDATAVKPENMSNEELAAYLSAACK